jgi:hypothetical protein
MLGSDPDFQQALESAQMKDLRDPVLLKHAIAAAVAVRDMKTAQLLVRDAPDSAIALPGLREYVEQYGQDEGEGPSSRAAQLGDSDLR